MWNLRNQYKIALNSLISISRLLNLIGLFPVKRVPPVIDKTHVVGIR
jgi:hypothetical protein